MNSCFWTVRFLSTNCTFKLSIFLLKLKAKNVPTFATV